MNFRKNLNFSFMIQQICDFVWIWNDFGGQLFTTQQIGLVFTCKLQKSFQKGLILQNCMFSQTFYPNLNFFTRIYPSYLLHFATLYRTLYSTAKNMEIKMNLSMLLFSITRFPQQFLGLTHVGCRAALASTNYNISTTVETLSPQTTSAKHGATCICKSMHTWLC